MRRTILFLAVLFMTVPAMAVSNVDITCSADGNEVTVSYESDANRIRAFGLDITITTADANITKVVPVDANYRIYPGQIVIVGGEVTDYNTAYAPGDLGDANVTIEMGSLYTMDTNYIGDANAGYDMQPGLSGTLLKFYVDGDCNYAVTENTVVGGIVMEDPDEEPVVDDPLCSGSVVVRCTVPYVVGEPNAIAQADIILAKLKVGDITTDCNDNIADGNVISTNPPGGVEVACESYVDIVVSTGPCGCACLGDVDGDGKIGSSDQIAIGDLRNLYGDPRKYEVLSNDPNYVLCADADQDGKIGSSDQITIGDWRNIYGDPRKFEIDCSAPGPWKP